MAPASGRPLAVLLSSQNRYHMLKEETFCACTAKGTETMKALSEGRAKPTHLTLFYPALGTEACQSLKFSTWPVGPAKTH